MIYRAGYGRLRIEFGRLRFYWNDSVHGHRWNAWQQATIQHEPGALKLGRFVVAWSERRMIARAER